jgi:acetyl-CoA carboxylase, biotin carboxylase subunit
VFRKVLIANRGEIAVRVIRALREMGIPSVAVYSDADRASPHVRMAQEAVHLGPAPSSESYLRADRIVEAARRTGAEAIHPGYGFLSENAEFAAACQAAGIVFIGPPVDAIRGMGSKTRARRLAIEAGAPVVPGAECAIDSVDQARRLAARYGYPVLLKASAGGGGKGMRRVDREEELEAALRDASSEAARAFGDSEIYMEKLLVRPRHVEIQIAGDLDGNVIHLGERECSLQRRHQKVMEECPSPLMDSDPDLRRRMGETAVRIAKHARYSNAGTVEFLVDEKRDFYFLEMNTRLQVEHPITELVTGVDLVKLQVRIAAGERLPFRQEDITWRGAAIECRIYAEDPDNNFFPSPGTITRLDRPSGPGVRLDSGVYEGSVVPIDYDPLLAKLTVHGTDRKEAIARMTRALDEYYVAGIKTNLSFFRQILEDEEFQKGCLHTGLIDEFFQRRPGEPDGPNPELEAVAAVVAAVHTSTGSEPAALPAVAPSRWRTAGRKEILR